MHPSTRASQAASKSTTHVPLAVLRCIIVGWRLLWKALSAHGHDSHMQGCTIAFVKRWSSKTCKALMLHWATLISSHALTTVIFVRAQMNLKLVLRCAAPRQQNPGINSQKQTKNVLSRTNSSCVMPFCPRSIESTARRGWHTCAFLFLFDLGTWLTKRHRVPHQQKYNKLAMILLCCRLLLCILLLILASQISLASEVVFCCVAFSRTLRPESYNLLVFDSFARFETHDLPNWCRL